MFNDLKKDRVLIRLRDYSGYTDCFINRIEWEEQDSQRVFRGEDNTP